MDLVLLLGTLFNAFMRTLCIVDGGNLRYFPFSLDYSKLYHYVTDTLGAGKEDVFYLGAMPTSYYFQEYDWLANDYLDLKAFELWVDEFEEVCKKPRKFFDSISKFNKKRYRGEDPEEEQKKLLQELEVVRKQLNLMFFLQEIGYQVEVTPLKELRTIDGKIKRKGDSDIRIATKVFSLLPEIQKLIFVSGDGDFLQLLKTVKVKGKDVVVMGYRTRDMNTNRTAKEIVSFAGGDFRNLASSDMRNKFEYRSSELEKQ